MEFTTVSGALGAEIRSVDLSRMNQAEAAQIRDAFHDHLMLVFRDQDLAPNAQVSLDPWREPSGHVELAVRHVRTFLAANTPA